MYKHILWLITVVFTLSIAGCGGGGSSSGSPTAKKSVTAVKMAGLLPDGMVIGAIELTINMPYGVTVQLNPTTGEPARDVVTLQGATNPDMVYSAVKYTPATATASGKLKFQVYNALGFGPVEYIKVQLDITPGYLPVATDFSLADFAVSDISNYDTIIITNPVYSVDIK